MVVAGIVMFNILKLIMEIVLISINNIVRGMVRGS
jgi:hypothetical protein